MSHNQAAAVINNNTTVIINMTNHAAKDLGGIEPIPSGTDAAAVEKTLSTAMTKTLGTYWKSVFGSELSVGNVEFAFFEGPAQLDVTMKVPNAVDRVNTDLNNWGVPTPSGFAENIVHTVLLNLIMSGGIIATSSGRKVLGPAQTTDWACITITGQSGSGDEIKHLIGYAFSAANA